MEREYNVGTWLTPSDEYIKDIKQTLVENNYANENTPIGELNPIVQQVINEVPETFEKMDLSKKKKIITETFEYVFYHSNGIDVYGSYVSSSSKGLWHINALTNEITKIYDIGYSWGNFFETSNGDVLISPIKINNGLILVNSKNVTQLITEGTYSYFYELNDNIYASTGNQLYVIKNGIASEAATISKQLTMFFESSSGKLYHFGSGGIIYIDDENAEMIHTTNSNYFFESSNGKLYCYSNGILYIEDNIVTQISTLAKSWFVFFELNNNIYVGGSGSSSGILHINSENNEVTQLFTEGSGWRNFFKDSNDIVYVSSNSQNYTGIYILEEATATKGYNKGYNFTNTIEDDNGFIYASGNNDANGIIRIKNGVISRIYYQNAMGEYNGWENFYKTKKGNIYATSKSSSYGTGRNTYAGIVKLKNGSATLIYSFDSNWDYFIENPSGLIISKTKEYTKQDFLLIDEDTDQVYLVKGGEQE